MAVEVLELDFTSERDDFGREIIFPDELPESILNEVRRSSDNVINFPDGSHIQKCPAFKSGGTESRIHPPYLDYFHPSMPLRRAKYDPTTGQLTGLVHTTLI